MEEFTKEEIVEYAKQLHKEYEEKWNSFASTYTPNNNVSFSTFIKAMRTKERPNGDVHFGEVKGQIPRRMYMEPAFLVWCKNDSGGITEYVVKAKDITWL